MRLSDQQFIFVNNVMKLLGYIVYTLEWKISIGEVWRRKVMQKLLVEKGWSKTMFSDHQNKMAIDIFVWIKDKYIHNLQKNKETIRPAGEFWESLHKNNYWGGNYKNFLDINHYGMKQIKD